MEEEDGFKAGRPPFPTAPLHVLNVRCRLLRVTAAAAHLHLLAHGFPSRRPGHVLAVHQRANSPLMALIFYKTVEDVHSGIIFYTLDTLGRCTRESKIITASWTMIQTVFGYVRRCFQGMSISNKFNLQ